MPIVEYGGGGTDIDGDAKSQIFRPHWFGAADFPANLPRIWRDHWAWLAQDDVAPVLVGEFGGRSVGGDGEGVWQRSLVSFMRDNPRLSLWQKNSNEARTVWR